MTNSADTAQESPDNKAKVTVMGSVVRKADTQAVITNGTDGFPADPYAGLYWGGAENSKDLVLIIEPTFKPGDLKALVDQNNTLAQCVEAMEVNIDGTGHSVELIEDATENEEEKTTLLDFFNNPYPGKSMIEIRRAIRRDIESSGNGYMEVIRSIDGQIALINHLDCLDMRLVRFDAPVTVERTITRSGKELMVSMNTRERRFVQLVNGTKVFFKEFGASRDLHRLTGEWVGKGVVLPATDRASEVIHFLGNKESKTPYGTPRWANQLPSVLGSRKAEEFNLEFFDGGGIPPVLVLVEGGTLGDTTKDLRNHLSGTGPNGQHRAAVVEVQSTSGSLDSSGNVRVHVERFGGDQSKDGMFQTYDANTSEHVRTAFRLPGMFLGKGGELNFATAYTAYMVAEAQVFYPERDEFDSKINHTLVKSLGIKNYRFRSLPLTLVDSGQQVAALEMMLKYKIINAEEAVSKLNEITGLEVEAGDGQGVSAPTPGAEEPGKSTGPQLVGRAVKSEVNLYDLAVKWEEAVEAPGATGGSVIAGELGATLAGLSKVQKETFHEILALRTLNGASADLGGLAELCACHTGT